jgi:hypothetical protein
MEVRPLHCYALISKPERKHSSEHKLSGRLPPGFSAMTCHNAKNVIICGHTSGSLYVFRRSKQLAAQDLPLGEVDYILPANNHEKLKDPKVAHKGPVTLLKIQPETNFLYSTSMDRTIKIWVSTFAICDLQTWI